MKSATKMRDICKMGRGEAAIYREAEVSACSSQVSTLVVGTEP